LSPSSRFGENRKLRAALVGAAIVVQLHLLFVVNLHDHGSRCPFPRTFASAELTQWHASPAPDLICAACRVSQQGALQLANATPLLCRDVLAGKLLVYGRLQVLSRFFAPLASRAPPLS
jgi:hypothetical protein